MTLFRKKPPLPGEIVLAEAEFSYAKVDSAGAIAERPSGRAELFVEPLAEGVGIPMIAVPAGGFYMGSAHRQGEADEEPRHYVSVGSFYLARTTVTQAQWKAVTGRLPPCRGKSLEHPVDRLSWDEATEFCERLYGKTGRRYRLPSEAEWEYACRAGSSSDFSFGDMITTDLANYVGRHAYKTGPVGEYRHGPIPPGAFPPNAFGLFDMHGNLDEWCQDAWHEDYTAAPSTAAPWIRGGTAERVVRGGSWHDPPNLLRCAARLKLDPSEGEDFVGLRLALSPA
jgi:formylglycine-generating enzyme required for sulfatase activity